MRTWRVVGALGLFAEMCAFAGCQSETGSQTEGALESNTAAAVEASDTVEVSLAEGALLGVMQGATRAFLGIPYAKPPLADLRWRLPQPVEKWAGVLDASQFGKRCAQRPSSALHNAASEDEDCLYLNVWTAAPKGKKLPVMIWIHGGGNANGSASEPLPLSDTGHFYSGQSLAEEHGVVVVTFNYRLGLFGFFAHPALTAEGSKSGNQGLWDQRAVFEWVQRNIARFGGDPQNVTIFGESAGALDVCLHVASSNSTGLFQRAISESGGCTTLQTTLSQAESNTSFVGTGLGCGSGDMLACLRTKRAADLLNFPMIPGRSYGPVVDGDLLPDQPRTLYDQGKFVKVPYLLGSNTDEGTLFVSDMVATQEQLTAALQSAFGELASQVAEHYPVSDFTDAMPNPFQAALARATGDRVLVCSTYDTALRVSNSAPVYLYNFDIAVAPSLSQGTFLGATHGSELTYVFGTDPAHTAEQQLARERTQRYWTNFAKVGDPNAGDDPKWPSFSGKSDVRLNLGITTTVIKDFRAKQCEFWRAQYASQFTAMP